MKVRTAIHNSLPIIYIYINNLSLYPHKLHSMTFTCGIQPTKVVTLAMKVLKSKCNICTLDLTDVYPLALGPMAIVLMHTHVTTITHILSCLPAFLKYVYMQSYTS